MRRVIGMPVHATDYEGAVECVCRWSAAGESRYVCVATVNNVIEARVDETFLRIAEEADLVTPDGMPLVWALRLLGTPGATRVCGPQLTPLVCRQAEALGIPVGFYGGRPEVLQALIANVRRAYPRLEIAFSSSPPFQPLTSDEDAAVVKEINASGTRILFVGLGTPKQEYWMAEHRHTIDAVSIGVGAAFDLMAGMRTRAPVWMQSAGLEWLFRMGQEPRRLWRRYLLRNPRFVALLAAQLIDERRRGPLRPNNSPIEKARSAA